MWFSCQPGYSYMHEIRCKAYVLILNWHNLKTYEQSIECTLIGYDANSKTYWCYNQVTNRYIAHIRSSSWKAMMATYAIQVSTYQWACHCLQTPSNISQIPLTPMIMLMTHQSYQSIAISRITTPRPSVDLLAYLTRDLRYSLDLSKQSKSWRKVLHGWKPSRRTDGKLFRTYMLLVHHPCLQVTLLLTKLQPQTVPPSLP